MTQNTDKKLAHDDQSVVNKGSNQDTFYVATPIYYVNGAPHIGSLYTTLAADVMARYYRAKLGSENVFFQTGTDEHGQKIAETAEEAGMEPKEFADSVVPEFKKAFKSANISYDHFIRTTDPRHEKEIQAVFTRLYERGYIYKGTYEGLYCVGCEKFITESDMVDGRCPLHPSKDLIEQKEENYFFKLKDFAPKLKKAIQKGEYRILPQKRENEILNRLDDVEDVSISRESVSWGIPIPWDTKHTFYVWVEALFNYYTGPQFLEGKSRFFPPDVHFLGKDILWFHAVIWEALLIAADLPLPKVVFAHGFFTVDGLKMGKSNDNVIVPEELYAKYTVDGARYLLLSAFKFGSDGDIALSKFDITYNADLAHGLGNLVARSAKLVEGEAGVEKPETFSEGFARHIENFDFDGALENIWKRIADADKYLNEKEPWKIKDDPAARVKVMKPVLESLAQIGYDLQPFMPDVAEKILKQFCDEQVTVESGYFAKVE